MHFSNHHQDAMKSVRMSSSPILEVQAVPHHRSWKEASDNSQENSRTNQNSSTKSFRLSSSQTSLSLEVLQKASTIYSNLKNSQQIEKESEKLRRVYLSEKQSGVIKDCGIMLPCAPPCSPTVDQLKIVEYVPSMNDIRVSTRYLRQIFNSLLSLKCNTCLDIVK
ncbi:uncharacterized protein LOC117120655 [Anneissia japonica]|uniref:uncharacterized protein LOC117120655 n=1 Tax=Anneissia japonica TaxID=1529436 RepID=UPI0014259681|nr:uncharacterized protein LOC117120655 [Anneissia japonica]